MDGPPHPDDPKADWRTWASGIDHGTASAGVVGHLAEWPPIHGVIATFLPMPGEVDLTSLMGIQHGRFVVPRIEIDDHLTLHDLRTTELVRHPWGFLEPSASSVPIDPDDVDVILVPGMAFDRHGGRLGRGKGMYDRLLADLADGVVRIGVVSDAGVVETVPMADHDMRLDWLATERGVFRTGPDLPVSTQSVVTAAAEKGIAAAMIRFPEGTKTSADAARAVGADLGAIAKSLVFVVDGEPVLVICSGDRRVDTAKLARIHGGRDARPAPLDTVREVTGFVAGGTPAVGHARPMPVLADASLARYRWVWSAGGTPDTVYPVALDRLIAATDARWVDLAERG
jgi:5,10-methenyltetrahydrofolate synthetase